MEILRKKSSLILILLSITTFLFHAYNLNWGNPFYFHPDERNIASVISQLSFPTRMNPHFFAYGSLPLYCIYLTGILVNFLTNSTSSTTVSFEQAILISRSFSLIFSLLLIPLCFIIGKILHSEKVGLFAAFFVATSVGLTQFAHFGTFELWLTFFTTLLFLFCLMYMKNKGFVVTLLMGITCGILISIKVSQITMVFIPLMIILIAYQKKKALFIELLVFFGCCTLLYVLSNPYVFLDTSEFLSSVQYESSVALGTLPVFYTGEFFNSPVILFHMIHVYPFLLNPLLSVLALCAFFYIGFQAVQKKNLHTMFLLLFLLILFLSQAFLFVKWTRYVIPTLPFIYLLVSLFLVDLSAKKKTSPIIIVSSVLLIFVSIIFAVSYFITAFVEQDTRIAARTYARSMIPQQASILSEVYDLGIIPFNNSFGQITLVNTYDLDTNNPTSRETLRKKLLSSSYIILPSQRILKTRLTNQQQFPFGNAFYQSLVSGMLPYKKIYETPCDIFCQITYLGDPVFRFEETINVFDRPTIYIFKKI